jgi:hypothetical protein
MAIDVRMDADRSGSAMFGLPVLSPAAHKTDFTLEVTYHV